MRLFGGPALYQLLGGEVFWKSSMFLADCKCPVKSMLEILSTLFVNYHLNKSFSFSKSTTSEASPALSST